MTSDVPRGNDALGRFGLPRLGEQRPASLLRPQDSDPFASPNPEEITLSITDVRGRESDEPGWLDIELDTTRGRIDLHVAASEGSSTVAIFLPGASGDDRGPADDLFVRLGQELVAHRLTATRVRYRQPGEFEECVADALAACSFLRGIGASRAVLVGHSFGGAVAIKAGELSGLTVAVCALSTQRYGTFEVEDLGKPLLLVHGARDEVLDRAASEDVYARARDPKRLVILEGTGHALAESSAEVFDLARSFIQEHAVHARS